MTLRSIIFSTAAVSAALLGSHAHAHDPSLHEPPATPAKAKPVDCVQLDDTRRYSNDPADPDTRALKARCDAEKKAAAASKPDAGKSR